MISFSFHFLVLVAVVIHQTVSQNNQNGCSQYLRNVHRMGPNVQGRLEIPTDEHFPRYKLKMSFSSPIHHLAIRQSRAKDTGTHREFVIDPMALERDGKLHLDIFVRLQRAFGTMSRLTRIVYNNLALCGDPVNPSEFDESFAAEVTSTTPVTIPVLFPTTNATTPSWKNKDYAEEEEDIF